MPLSEAQKAQIKIAQANGLPEPVFSSKPLTPLPQSQSLPPSQAQGTPPVSVTPNAPVNVAVPPASPSKNKPIASGFTVGSLTVGPQATDSVDNNAPNLNQDRTNYSNAAHIAEAKMAKAKQPWNLVDEGGKKYVTIDNPEAQLRNHEALLNGTLISDLAERQAQGYWKGVDPKAILDEHLYNGVTGEFANDDSETGKYLSEMQNRQLKPFMDSWREKQQMLQAISSDKGRMQGNTWKMDRDEMTKADDPIESAARTWMSGLSHVILQASKRINKAIQPGQVAKYDKQFGYRNTDERYSAAEKQITNTIGDLSQHVMAVASDNYGGWDKVFNDFTTNGANGLSSLANGQLSSDVRDHLLATGTSKDDVDNIKDAQGLTTALINSASHMAGEMAPGGAMDMGFRWAHTLGTAMKVPKAMMAANRYENIVQKLYKEGGKTFEEGAKISKAVRESDEWKGAIEAAAQTDEGRKYLNVMQRLDQVSTPERILSDGAAFGLSAIAQGKDSNDVLSHVTNGMIFGAVNSVIAGVASRLATRSLAAYREATPLGQKFIEPLYQNRVQVASALSNIVSNPVSSIINNAWTTGDINKLIPFDTDEGRRQVLFDTIMGVGFGTHAMFNSYRYGGLANSAQASEYARIYRDYKDAVDANVKNMTAGLETSYALHRTAEQELHKASDEAVAAGPTRKVTTNDDHVNSSEDDAFIKDLRTSEQKVAEIKGEDVKPKETVVEPPKEDFIKGEPVKTPSPTVETPLQDVHNEAALQESSQAEDALPRDPLEEEWRRPVEQLYGAEPLAPAKTQRTMVDDIDERWKIVHGTDFDPDKATIPDLMKVMTTPLHDKEDISPVTLKAYTQFLKNLPDGLKIKFTSGVEVNGVKTPMAFDSNANTINIDMNSSAMPNVDSAAATLAEELVHSVTVKGLSDPDVADKVTRDRLEILRQLREGKFDDKKIRLFDGTTVPVKSDVGARAMDYYLGSNEEFVAGAYNSNLPLHDIVSSAKLPGQRRYTAIEKIKGYFGKQSSVLDSYVDMAQERIAASGVHGAWPLGLDPLAYNENAELKKAESLVRKQQPENDFEATREKASTVAIGQVYGVTGTRSVLSNWAKTLNSNGLEQLKTDVKQATDNYIESNGITGAAQKYVLHEQMQNAADSFALQHGNDEQHTVIAVKDDLVQRTKSPTDKSKSASIGADYKNVINSDGNGQPFSFTSKPFTGMRETLGSVVDRMEANGHTHPAATKLLRSVIGLKRADIQNYNGDYSPQNLTTPQANRLATKLMDNAGVYMLPRGDDGFQALDAMPFFDIVSDYLPKQYVNPMSNAQRIPISEVLNHVHNMISFDWLHSFDGGNKPDLAKKLGPYIDLGKVMNADPSAIEKMSPGDMAQFGWDGRMKNAPEKMQEVFKTITPDDIATLRREMDRIWKDPFTEQNMPFGRNKKTSDVDKAREAIQLLSGYATDPSLKSLERKSKIAEDGGKFIPIAKDTEKYGNAGRLPDPYKQHKDLDTFRSRLGKPYADHFDDNGDPIAAMFEQKGFSIDNSSGKPVVCRNTLLLNHDLIPDEFPQLKEHFAKLNSDGASIITSRDLRDMMNAMAGSRNVDSFKNGSVTSDGDHTRITKTAFHYVPLKSENPLYAEMTRFAEGLERNNIHAITMTSAIKSGGTFRLKEGKAGVAGAEDAIIGYDNAGNVRSAEDGDPNGLQAAIYKQVLSGGTVPGHMVHKVPMYGKQAEAFISVSQGTNKYKRGFSQMDMAHAVPGQFYYETHKDTLHAVDDYCEQRYQETRSGVQALLGSDPITPENAKAAGKVIQQLHQLIVSDVNSDDPNASSYHDDTILYEIAKCWKRENGEAVALPRAKDFLALHQGLIRGTDTKPSALTRMLRSAEEDRDKRRVFGKEFKLVPSVNMADMHDAMLHKETQDLMANSHDAHVGQMLASQLVDYSHEVYNRHFDEKGMWRPGSNGVILGEEDLRDLNARGRLEHGSSWKDVKYGSKILGDLKPTDAASSNPPLEVVGIIPGGKGMMLPPHITGITGRDFDNDGFGVLAESPEWQGRFVDFWNQLRADKVHIDQGERTVTTKNGERLTHADLEKAAATYYNGRNKFAQMFNVPQDATGMMPLSGIDHWKKQNQAALNIGLPISELSKYASLSRQGSDMVRQPGLNTQPIMSFVKQMGVVDAHQITPIDFRAMQDKILFSDKIGAMMDYKAQKLARAYTNRIADDSANSLTTTLHQISNDGTESGKKIGSAIDAFGVYAQNRSVNGFTATEYSKVPDELKAIHTELQGRALLDGLDKDVPDQVQVYHNGTLKVVANIDGGQLAFKIKSKEGQQSFRTDQIFNEDGSFTPEYKAIRDRFGIPDTIFYSEGVNAYAPRNPETGRFSVLTTYNSLTPKKSTDLYATAVAKCAKAAHPDAPGYAASAAIITSGRPDVAQSIETLKRNGVTPIVSDNIERKYVSTSGYNPETGQWDAVEKVGKKFVMINGVAAEPPGEVIGESMKTKSFTKDEEGKGNEEVIHEIHTVSLPMPLETYVINKMQEQRERLRDASSIMQLQRTEATNAVQKDGQTATYGAFNLLPRMDSEAILAKAAKEAGISLFSAAGEPDKKAYEDVFDHVRERCEKTFGAVPTDVMKDVLEQISPGFLYSQVGSASSGVSDEVARKNYVALHAYDTIRTLEKLHDDRKKLLGVIDKQSAFANRLRQSNSFQARSALDMVNAASDNLVTHAPGDVMAQSGVYTNGQRTANAEPYTYESRSTRMGEQTHGAVVEAAQTAKHLFPLQLTNNTKVQGEQYAEAFKRDVGKIRADLSSLHEEGLMDSGLLPETTISATFNDVNPHQSIVTQLVHVDGVARGDVDNALKQHFSSVMPELSKPENRGRLNKVVNSFKSIMAVQALGKQMANIYSSINGNLLGQTLHSTGTDPEEAAAEFGRQMHAEHEENIGYWANISPEQAYAELCSVDNPTARGVLRSMSSENDLLFHAMYAGEEGVKHDPYEWQKMMQYEMGQKIFGWQEGFHDLCSYGADGNPIRKPLLAGRLAMMQDLVDYKINQTYDVSQRHRASINQGVSDINNAALYEAQAGGHIPEYELGKKLSVAQYMQACYDVMKDRDVEDVYGHLVHIDPDSNGVATRMTKKLNQMMRDQSYVSNVMYQQSPDTNPTAHANTSWLLTNAYGQNLEFSHNVNAADFQNQVYSSMSDHGGIMATMDTPSLDIGRHCLVQHTLPDGKEKVISGSWVGSFLPKVKVYDAQSGRVVETGENSQRPYAIFHDMESKMTHVMPVDAITNVIAHNGRGWRGSLDARVDKTMLNAPEFLTNIAGKAFEYQDSDGNAKSMRITGAADTAADSVRDMSFAQSVERSAFNIIKNAPAQVLYLGGRYVAGMGAAAALSVLHPDLALLGMGLFIQQGAKLGMHYAGNVISNYTSGSRMNPQFIAGNPLVTKISGIYRNFTAGAETGTADLLGMNQGGIDVQQAALAAKMNETLTGTDIQRSLGLEKISAADYRKMVSNGIFIQRTQEKLQAIHDNEYNEYRAPLVEMRREMVQKDIDNTEAVADIQKKLGWEYYLQHEHPEIQQEIEKRGLTSAIEKGSVVWDSPEGRLALDQASKLSDLQSRFFGRLGQMSEAGVPLLTQIGKGMISASVGLKTFNHVLEKLPLAMTGTETKTTADAIRNSKEIYDQVNAYREAAGLPAMTDQYFKNDVVGRLAALNVGAYDRNAYQQGILGGWLSLFTGYNSNKNQFEVSNHRDLEGRFRTIKNWYNEDPDFADLVTPIGLLHGDWHIWDKNKQQSKSTALGIMTKLSGLSIGVALTAAWMALAGNDDKKRGEHLKTSKDILAAQRTAGPVMNTLERMLSNDNALVQIGSSLLDKLAFHTNTFAGISMATVNKDGYIRPSDEGGAEKLGSRQESFVDRGVSQGFGVAPVVSSALNLAPDAYQFIKYGVDSQGKDFVNYMKQAYLRIGYPGTQLSKKEDKKLNEAATLAWQYADDTKMDNLIHDASTILAPMASPIYDVTNQFFERDKEIKTENKQEYDDSVGHKKKKPQKAKRNKR